MDITNRNPDEVKEREFETTGYADGSNLSEGKNLNDSEVKAGEINKGKEGGLEKAEDNESKEYGRETSPQSDPKNETAGIP